MVRVQRLIAAAAALAGRERPGEADLWPIVFALPTEQAQSLGRDVLRDFLTASENSVLLAAPLESSLGPQGQSRADSARRRRHPGRRAPRRRRDGADGALEAWRLRVEGVAREIDATFAPDTLPPDLAALRERIVAALAPS